MSFARSASNAQLVLGTAQWGMDYGIANRSGQAPKSEVREILELARRSGVHILDTARAYGQSEEVIGALTANDAHWRIITKVSPDLPEDDVASIAAVEASLRESREALARDELDTVLLHRPEHLGLGDGAAWRYLLQERKRGGIRRVGVSVLSSEQGVELIEHPEIDVLQVPFNLLDSRIRQASFFDRAEAEGKELFVRSVFLQGLAFLPSEQLDPFFAPLSPVLDALDHWASEHGTGLPDLFLRYARAQGAHLVLGCESTDQLRQNLASWDLGPLTDDEIQAVEALVPQLPAALLNPARWQLNERP